MTSDLLRIPVTLAVDCNGRPFAEVGDCRVLLNTDRLPSQVVSMLANLDEVARSQFADAQKPVNGCVPGPGGMYPAGSQG